MIKEIVLGMLIGLSIFLVWIGYNVLPIFLLVLLGGLLYFTIFQKGLLGNFNANLYKPSGGISFEDIGGQDIAKNELKEALEFLIKSEKVKEMGIRPLKGILLTGPPGTGKTLLAKAAAAYTDSVFVATNGSEFIEMYAGVGAQRVRSIFKKARDLALAEKKNSSIIFIDEIDVLANKRGTHKSSHMEYDQTLNQLLVEMDGIRNDDKVRILVIAATNRADMLDPALLRPGRFDRQVKVDLPDKKGRLEILKLHTRNKPLDKDVDLEAIAGETFGFSGAHLESIANEAAILALRENRDKISQRHFREAVDKVMLGEKLNNKPSDEEIYRVAVHEAGHALASELIFPNSVSHVTITSRGNALGYTRHNPKDDSYLYTKEYLENQIQIFLAGSAAEQLLLGNKSTGATNDFQQAVNLSKQIIYSGLSDLGVISEEDLSKDVLHEEISRIIRVEEEKVKKLLNRNLHILKNMADQLRRNESIVAEEISQLINDSKCA
ncbi:MAG: AAA family ATPase [Clostridia bacterium]|nr:AAA family ATPase [Clostridia bacterium]